MYHIACFPGTSSSEETFEVVHENWLLPHRQSCYYPPYMGTQFTKALLTAMIPASSWKIYDLRILGSYESYEEASEKLSLAEYTSNLDSDDDNTEKGKKRRKIIKAKQPRPMCNSDSSDSDVNPEKELEHRFLPSPISCDIEELIALVSNTENALSHNSSHHQSSPNQSSLPQSSSHLNSPTSTLNDFNSLPLMSHQPNNLHSSHSLMPSVAAHSSFPSNAVATTPFEKCLLHWMEKTDKVLAETTSTLQNVLIHLSQNSSIPWDGLPTFPLTTLKDVEEFEEYLKEPNNFNKVVQYFSGKGGDDEAEATRRIMKSLMTSDLSTGFNWQGRGGKIPFKSTKMKQMVICAVRKHGKSDEKKIEEQIKAVLKYAPLRVKYANNSQVKQALQYT